MIGKFLKTDAEIQKEYMRLLQTKLFPNGADGKTTTSRNEKNIDL